MIITTVLLAFAAVAPAADFVLPGDAAALVTSARALGAASKAAPKPALRLAAMTLTAGTPAPIDRGFRGLGRTGKTGRIKGPGLFGQGDGVYTVVESGPWQIVLAVKTGYIDATFTLKRDQATGKDSLGVTGRLWDADRNAWTPPLNTMNDGRVTYDPSVDQGTITWLMNGAWTQDAYGGGVAGSKGMSITLGGHQHDFTQD